MNKVRKWLIHKLGGVAEIPLSPHYKPHVVYNNISPVKFGYDYIAPEYMPPDIVEKSIAELLGKQMLDKGFIEIKLTELNLPNEKSIKYDAEVYVIKKEEYEKEKQNGKD